MKLIRKKLKYKSIIILSLLLIFIIGAEIKIAEYENTKKSETTGMEQYRMQYLVENSEEMLYLDEKNENNNIDAMHDNGVIRKLYDLCKNQINYFNIIFFNIKNKVSLYIHGTEKVNITNLSSTISSISKEIALYTINATSKEILYHMENRIIDDNTISKSKEIDSSCDIDCILKIPSIHLEKPVYNINTKTYLEKFYLVTAYDNMNFKSGGTYIIYGHNSYVENLSFQSLPKVQLNDTILIECMNNDYEFLVTDIQRVNTEQISEYFVQEENKIVLVACTNQSTKSNPEYLVVIAKK